MGILDDMDPALMEWAKSAIQQLKEGGWNGEKLEIEMSENQVVFIWDKEVRDEAEEAEDDGSSSES